MILAHFRKDSPRLPPTWGVSFYDCPHKYKWSVTGQCSCWEELSFCQIFWAMTALNIGPRRLTYAVHDSEIEDWLINVAVLMDTSTILAHTVSVQVRAAFPQRRRLNNSYNYHG